MSVLPRTLTVEELDSFPNDGHRYEIIDGDLMMSASPNKGHQRVLRRLTILFDQFATATDSGEVFFAPVDVRFTQTDQVQPDLIFIRREHSGRYHGSFMFGAPDIVVEVLSPSTSSYDEVAKFRLYEANGVPEYWIVDPVEEKIRRFTLSDGAYELAPLSSDSRIISTILPGLAVDPAALFCDLDA